MASIAPQALFRGTPFEASVRGPGAPPELTDLTLSASTIAENSASGTVIGAIQGMTPGSTLSIASQSDANWFAIDGSNNLIVGLTKPDYETNPSPTVTVRETLEGAANTPKDTVLTVTVTDVAEAPTVLDRTDYASTATVMTHNVLVNKACNVGDLLVATVVWYDAGIVTPTATAGWTKWTERRDNSAGGMTIWTKVATSTSESLSVTISTMDPSHATAQTVRLAGANTIYTSAIDYSAGSHTPNPPALTLPQSRSATWLISMGYAGTVTGPPAGYGNMGETAYPGIGWKTNTSWKQATLTTDDPGVYQGWSGNSSRWICTMAAYQE